MANQSDGNEFEENLDQYPRVYTPFHPTFEYYQSTPTGLYITPKASCLLETIKLDCVLTREGAAFSEVLEALNEKTNNGQNK